MTQLFGWESFCTALVGCGNESLARSRKHSTSVRVGTQSQEVNGCFFRCNSVAPNSSYKLQTTHNWLDSLWQRSKPQALEFFVETISTCPNWGDNFVGTIRSVRSGSIPDCSDYWVNIKKLTVIEKPEISYGGLCGNLWGSNIFYWLIKYPAFPLHKAQLRASYI